MTETALYFSSLLEELQKGRDVMAVTLIDSVGSAPRSAGARMLVGLDGRFFGTIGGGAVEYKAEKEAAGFLLEQASAVRQYDLSKHSGGLGMICGGRVTAAFHYINAGRKDVKALCRTALLKLKAPCCLWLFLEIPGRNEADEGKRDYGMGIYQPAGEQADTARTGKMLCPSEDHGLPEVLFLLEVPSAVRRNCDAGRGGCQKDGARIYYLEQIAENCLVHLFGGGHVTRELGPLLVKTGFSYAVYDDREEYLKPEDFPDALGTAAVSFEHLKGCLFPAAEHYFVIMTRGHLYDFQAQAFVMGLDRPGTYIGVMGSKKKTKELREKLMKLGFSREALDLVSAPVGLSIGAETPAEIAVSIAAQLIQVRCKTRKKRRLQHEEN